MSCKANSRGWSLNGTVFEKGGINKAVPPHVVATKVVPKASKPPKASVNMVELRLLKPA